MTGPEVASTAPDDLACVLAAPALRPRSVPVTDAALVPAARAEESTEREQVVHVSQDCQRVLNKCG